METSLSFRRHGGCESVLVPDLWQRFLDQIIEVVRVDRLDLGLEVLGPSRSAGTPVNDQALRGRRREEVVVAHDVYLRCRR
jgi:hypothetical protein